MYLNYLTDPALNLLKDSKNLDSAEPKEIQKL